MDSPGREIEVVSGFMARGCSGGRVLNESRCPPFGLPVEPMTKVTGNPRTASEREDDIDVDAFDVIEVAGIIETAGKSIYDEILAAVSGKLVEAEIFGYSFVDIWRIGLIL